jgi:hypothetical protein
MSGGAAVVVLVLHAHLCRYAGDRARLEVPYEAGATVGDYVRRAGIPAHEFYAVVRGGALSKDLGAEPAPGEVVELLPAMSGG